MSESDLTSSSDIDAQEIVRRIQRLGGQIGIVVPSTAAEARERVIEACNRSAAAFAEFGIYCLLFKCLVPRGKFLSELRACDVSPLRANRAMVVAKLLLRESDRGAKLIGLSRPKLSELARVEPDVFDEAIERGDLDLDEVACMSDRQLRAEVRRLSRKDDDQAIQIDRQRERIHRLESDVGVIAGREFPASVVRTREEVAVFAEQAKLQIAAIAQQARRFLLSPDLGQTRLERGRNIQDGGKPIALHIAAVIAEALDAQAEIRRQLGDFLPSGDWGDEHQPDPLEAEQILELAQWRDVHVRHMDASAARREVDRVQRGAIKRGRGRPAKRRTIAPRRPGRPKKGEAES